MHSNGPPALPGHSSLLREGRWQCTVCGQTLRQPGSDVRTRPLSDIKLGKNPKDILIRTVPSFGWCWLLCCSASCATFSTEFPTLRWSFTGVPLGMAFTPIFCPITRPLPKYLFAELILLIILFQVIDRNRVDREVLLAHVTGMNRVQTSIKYYYFLTPYLIRCCSPIHGSTMAEYISIPQFGFWAYPKIFILNFVNVKFFFKYHRR